MFNVLKKPLHLQLIKHNIMNLLERLSRFSLMICYSFLFLSNLHAQNVQNVQEDYDRYPCWIAGMVVDAVTREGLSDVKTEILNLDSTSIYKYIIQKGIGWNDLRPAYFLPIPKEGKYLVRLSKTGYHTKIVEKEFSKLHKHERVLSQSEITLSRLPKEQHLKEVVITATKIKFYSKGDTLVYNADAFQLQEGSMLDALIRQLPGVELKDDGRILVNGEYVESLLLNGEDFFKKDRTVMLENLPAYMVKNVQLYKKAGRRSEMLGHKVGDESLVMDVRLKKQYSIGWIANAETAAGTADRYMARLFALRFSDHSRFSAFAAINNVNEYVKPGVGSEWKPSVGSGVTTTRHGGLDYLINDAHRFYKVEGNVEVRSSNDRYDQRSNSVSFLAGGDSYEKSKYDNKTHNFSVLSNHELNLNWHKVKWQIKPSLMYVHSQQSVQSASATFRHNVDRWLTSGGLDSLYMPALSTSLQAEIVNHQRNFEDICSHYLTVDLSTLGTIALPRTNNCLEIETHTSLSRNDYQTHRHKYYDYADAATNTDFRNEYNPTLWQQWQNSVQLAYWYFLGSQWQIHPSYRYEYTQKKSNSDLYRLDRLDRWGYGQDNQLTTLPSVADWAQQTYDGRYSLYTRQHDYQHRWGLNIHKVPFGRSTWDMTLDLPLSIEHNRLNYQRPSLIDTLLRRTQIYFCPKFDLSNMWEKRDSDKQVLVSRKVQIGYNLNVQASQMTNLVDFTDKNNPLAITLGNPSLKSQSTHSVNADYAYNNVRLQRLFSVSMHYDYINNALAMSYLYNRSTGARIYRPENISGNWSWNTAFNFTTPLDKLHRLTLQISSNTALRDNADLIGFVGEGPAQRSIVHTFNQSNSLHLDYRQGNFQFSAKTQGVWTHATSRRDDFTTINAFDFSYGLTAQAEFPWKLQLSTDITMYSRRGYEDPTMNDNDLVWNARLSKQIFRGRMSIMLDGFDLLSQLSNVRQVLNGQGRTETWYNVIPSYFMAHLIYHLNVIPKNKK